MIMYVFTIVLSLTAVCIACPKDECASACQNGGKNPSCPLISEDKTCRTISAMKENLDSSEVVIRMMQDYLKQSKYKMDELQKSSCDGSLNNKGNSGNSGNCSSASSCDDLKNRLGFNADGVYKIWPRYLNHPVHVYCDMSTTTGGWTVIQRRADMKGIQENFYRNWHDYKTGFGDVNGEFWIGNDAIFALSNERPTALRIDFEDFEGVKKYAQYNVFLVSTELQNYKLNVGSYSGDAGDSLAYHNNKIFLTFGKTDNDPHKCVETYKGAWWYGDCHEANLNGLYLRGNHTSFADGIEWKSFRGYFYSLKTVEMKLGPSKA